MDHEQLMALGGFAIMGVVAAALFVLQKVLDRLGLRRGRASQNGYRVDFPSPGVNVDGTPMGMGGTDVYGRPYGSMDTQCWHSSRH